MIEEIGMAAKKKENGLWEMRMYIGKDVVKAIKNIVETMDDYAFYTAEDKVAFDLAIKALEHEETCENKDDDYMMFKCSVCGGRSIECMISFNYCPNCGRRVEK